MSYPTSQNVGILNNNLSDNRSMFDVLGEDYGAAVDRTHSLVVEITSRINTIQSGLIPPIAPIPDQEKKIPEPEGKMPGLRRFIAMHRKENIELERILEALQRLV